MLRAADREGNDTMRARIEKMYTKLVTFSNEMDAWLKSMDDYRAGDSPMDDGTEDDGNTRT